MGALSTVELLDLWERGIERAPVERALDLLAAAWPQASRQALADLSIGRRDESLMTLRESHFGSSVLAVTRCPACAEDLELAFDLADIRSAPGGEGGETCSVIRDGYEVRFRLPTSRDLLVSTSLDDLDGSRLRLLERCVLSVHRHGDETADALPPAVLEAVVAEMAERDPQADVELAPVCPGCGHKWKAVFDIVSFFWSEIDTWAMRLLVDVHLLASAYGWSESDILRLSAWRREIYLEALAR